MGFFEYIFYLGIINIVFNFIWKWVFMLPFAFLFVFLKFDKGVYFAKAFGIYLLVSLTAILTLKALETNSSIWSLFLFSFVGLFVLFIGLVESSYEAQKVVGANFDHDIRRQLQYDKFFLVAAPLLFIIILFIPAIAVNSVTIWLFNVIGWVRSLPIIGWLLGFGGMLVLLGVIWHGILISGFLLGSLFWKTKQPTIQTAEDNNLKPL